MSALKAQAQSQKAKLKNEAVLSNKKQNQNQWRVVSGKGEVSSHPTSFPETNH